MMTEGMAVRMKILVARRTYRKMVLQCVLVTGKCLRRGL